jgi:hypothetical protein
MPNTRRLPSLLLGLLSTALVALAPSGCGDDPLTLGKYCSSTGTAYCDRAVTCDVLTSAERSACVTDFQAACCGDDSTCGELPDPGREDDVQRLLNACVGALKTFDCASVAAQEAPAECLGQTSALLSSAASPKAASFDARAAGNAARAGF